MKNKSALLAGLSMFLCFSILMAGGTLGKTWGVRQLSLGIAVCELGAFLLPAILVILLSVNSNPIKIPTSTKRLQFKNVRFSICVGFITCMISFLLNMLCLQLGGQDISGVNPNAILGRDIRDYFILFIIAVVIIPAIVEEMYMRGILYGIFSQYGNTGICLLLSGLFFAMLHGSLYNFFGPFIAGITYAWLTFVFDSVWPAVIAHAANNFMYLILLWVTDTYSAFGIWDYVPVVCIVITLILAYFTLMHMEKMLLSGRVPHFTMDKYTNKQAFFIIVLNPASIVFILAYFAKIVFKII